MWTLILQFGPWVIAAAAALFGFTRHQQAKTATAEAQQKVAEATTAVEQAKTQAAEVRDGEAQANAAAARAGADASKERTHVENDVAALPSGAAADELRNEWSRPGEDAGRGAVGAGQDQVR
ncbi:hypothetical protein [Caballeronia novacaledonica]|uniref:hypothetical protein n=1 Tax=Caballeronia novacaledonica TaxID=1544861 RepID=UPI0015E6BCE2|nr:hypothetical protein [Caballeronia novacaledonica]